MCVRDTATSFDGVGMGNRDVFRDVVNMADREPSFLAVDMAETDSVADLGL